MAEESIFIPTKKVDVVKDATSLVGYDPQLEIIKLLQKIEENTRK